jgi:DNA polymerase-3 subunit delta'
MSSKAASKSDDPPLLEPRQNLDLMGHEAAEETLLRAWESGRLPHAWLITGARGIGKATLAYRFARFVLAGGNAKGGGLFDDEPSSLTLDPDHPACRQVVAGGHPDMFVLQPGMPHPDRKGQVASDILVGHVRQAVHFCNMTPASAQWRVVIVDPVDEMNPNAANALLKVLEEPPRNALILLVSHAPARLLATIRSRCSQLALPALDEQTVRGLLAQHAPGLDGDDATALARLSEGSIGRALMLAGAGGLDLYRDLIGLLRELPGAPAERLHGFADHLSQGGEAGSFRLGGELLGWWLARLIRAGASDTTPDEVVSGEGEAMRRLLDRASLEQWLELWEKIGRLFGRAERANFDRKQVVLTAFLEIDALTAR